MSKNKTNQKKVEKLVSKKLKKLIKKAAEASGESRLVVMASKDCLLVKAVEEKGGASFIDQYLHIVHGLDNRVKMIRDYDGKDLKRVNTTPFSLGTTDFAAIQGLDVDELADRGIGMDHDGDYLPRTESNARTKLEEYLSVKPEPSTITPMMDAYYNAALQHAERALKSANKELDELREESAKLKEEIKKLADELETKTAKNISLTQAIKDMCSELGKNGQISANDKDLHDKMDTLAATEESVESVEPTNSETSNDVKIYGVFADFANYNRLDIIPSITDTHMFTFLDTLKELRNVPGVKLKSYDMGDIIRELGNMYEHFDINSLTFALYVPSDVMMKKSYTETVYALVIAAAVPASYVGKFIEFLLSDYRKGLFVPTRKNSIPKNFEEMLESIYPQVMRIQDLLFKDATKLPYVYAKDTLYNRIFYSVGCKKADSPRKLGCLHLGPYVVIPKFINPYDYPSESLKVFLREKGHTELKDVSLNNPHYTLRMQLEEYAKDKELFPDLDYPKTWQEWIKFVKENMMFYNVTEAYSVSRDQSLAIPVNEEETKEEPANE